jgi:hypothetical protein
MGKGNRVALFLLFSFQTPHSGNPKLSIVVRQRMGTRRGWLVLRCHQRSKYQGSCAFLLCMLNRTNQSEQICQSRERKNPPPFRKGGFNTSTNKSPPLRKGDLLGISYGEENTF